MRRTRSACCERTASGHAAAPPSSVINLRRSLRVPPCFRRKDNTPRYGRRRCAAGFRSGNPDHSFSARMSFFRKLRTCRRIGSRQQCAQNRP